MADTLTKTQRHYCMSQNKGKDTKPELFVRSVLYSMGYRYRLHYGDLPGKPDIVFPGRRKIIFVHGCFWHRHRCKKGASFPETEREFWQAKFQKTIKRDKTNQNVLKKNGWEYLIIWECQLKKTDALLSRIEGFLK